MEKKKSIELPNEINDAISLANFYFYQKQNTPRDKWTSEDEKTYKDALRNIVITIRKISSKKCSKEQKTELKDQLYNYDIDLTNQPWTRDIVNIIYDNRVTKEKGKSK